MADWSVAPGATFEASVPIPNFSGQAANIRWRIYDGPTNTTLSGPANFGTVEAGSSSAYSAVLTAPTTAGEYDVACQDPTGTIVYGLGRLEVRYSLAASGTPQPGDLFTVQDLKNHLRSIKATDPSKDDELQMLVTSVSDAAAQYTNHRWAQEMGVTKTYRFDDTDGGYLDLNPYDLRVLSSVQIDTDISAYTLDPSQYRKEPRNKPHGVYTHLDVWLGVGRRNVNFWADATPWWSGREIQVLGDWGWPSIPSSLRLSAIAYAAELFTNPTGAAAVSKADSSKDFAPRAGTFIVPDAYLALWAPFRRIEF